MVHEEIPQGRPLTDRPRHAGRILSRRDQEHLEDRSHLETDPAVLDRLVGIERILTAVGELVVTQRRRVLWSGTALIGETGVWHRRLPVGSRAIFVINYSGNGNVTVASGAPLGAAPGPGGGTHNCPAGVAAVFNADTDDWTLYGTPGNAVDVQIFSIPITPTASGDI